ncbi:MAG: secretin N-terminal domain-containing protein [Phycisphaerae bacterium]
MKRAWIWTTMLAILLTATAVDAQEGRKGDKDRKEAKRRREGRGDREGKSAFEPRREKRQGKQKNRPRRRGDRPRPKMLVLHLQHISADSFLQTMKQLGETPEIGKILKQIPHAVNEESNTIVVIAPPELIAMVEQIADGVDKPNEHRRNARRREKAEKTHAGRKGGKTCPHCGMSMAGDESPSRRPMMRHKKMRDKQRGAYPMMGHRPGGKCPVMGPSQGRPRRMHGKQGAKRPRRGKSAARCHQDGSCPTKRGKAQERHHPERRGREDRGDKRGRQAHPQRPPMVGMLLHPKMVHELKLSRDQVEKVEEVVDDLHQKMEHLGKRIANARKDKSPHELREMGQKVRQRVMQLHKEAAEKIQRTLTAQQRKQWQEMRSKMHGRRGQMHRKEGSEARREGPGRRRHPRWMDSRQNRRRDEEDDDERRKRRGRRRREDRDEDDDE